MTIRGSADRLSPAELASWQGFLRANAQVLRLLDADLRRTHGLSESQYDVLITLGVSPGRRLRMMTLAEKVLMSHSGLSRLVDELERGGLIVRQRREDDARSFDIVLTPAGRKRLKAANRTHLHRVRELFLDRLSDDQLQHLIDVWNAIDPNLIAGNTQRPMPTAASKSTAVKRASAGD